MKTGKIRSLIAFVVTCSFAFPLLTGGSTRRQSLLCPIVSTLLSQQKGRCLLTELLSFREMAYWSLSFSTLICISNTGLSNWDKPLEKLWITTMLLNHWALAWYGERGIQQNSAKSMGVLKLLETEQNSRAQRTVSSHFGCWHNILWITPHFEDTWYMQWAQSKKKHRELCHGLNHLKFWN